MCTVCDLERTFIKETVKIRGPGSLDVLKTRRARTKIIYVYFLYGGFQSSLRANHLVSVH